MAEIETRRGTLARVFGSESFLEKVGLLVATALLSGLVIPYIGNGLQRTRARADAVAASQRQLLDGLAATILTYETLALDVSWYRTADVKDVAMHERAFSRYNERFVELLATWRTQIVRARTLASPAAAQAVSDFLVEVFREQDSPMNSLHRRSASDAEWEAQHRRNEEMLGKAQNVIDALATDLQITRVATASRFWPAFASER